MHKRKNNAFPLDSSDCELLMAFEEAPSIPRLARARGRDPSVISRQLASLSAQAPVLRKERGRWELTPLGRSFASWARDAVRAQRRLLQERRLLRLVATQEFASRVLVPGLRTLLGDEAESVVPAVSTDPAGVERALLAGEADIGFDCGRPESPAIRFRLVRAEPFVAVARPRFLKQGAAQPSKILELPYLLYPRISPTRVMKLERELPNIFGQFGDIASVRAACLAGLGWSVLPMYTVWNELRGGELRSVELGRMEQERFGVWWPSGSAIAADWVDRCVAWLKRQDLGTE